MPADSTTAISVLIRTFNSGKTLERVLAGLPLAAGDELVVVDSGSTDETLAIASRHGARVIRPEGPFNYSKALNAGFAAARNPWVLVLSSHCIPGSDRMLESFRQAAAGAAAAVAVVYGNAPLFEPKDGGAAPEYIDQARWEQTRRMPGGNTLALYRRGCWEEHPFAEHLVTAEDIEWFLWAVKRGYGALRMPQAWALYRNQGSLRYMFCKGWVEAMNSATLLKAQPPELRQAGQLRNLLIPAGILGKKLLLGRVPPGTCLCRMVYLLGACRASARLAKRG